MNIVKDKITTSHWCFQTNLISLKKWFKSFFNNFIFVVINHEFYVVALSIYYALFIIVFIRNYLIALVNWIFHVSDFLRSVIICVKYGLILLTYPSIDNVLLLSPLLSYSICTYSHWFVIRNFFNLKRFLISLIILPLIVSFSFSSLERCLISLIVMSWFFFNLKRFLTSLIMLSWPWPCHHYTLWKELINFFLKKKTM